MRLTPGTSTTTERRVSTRTVLVVGLLVPLLAGYEVAGVDSRWSGGVAGVIGCLVVLACTSALMLLGKRSTPGTYGGG